MKASRKRNVARKAKNARPATRHASPQPNPRTAQSEPPTAQSAEAQPVTQPAPASAGFVSQNRANAQHSTGPRTPEGKAASSQNACKHGLSIQRHAVLRDEDPALYAQLLAELREIYQPLSRREDLAEFDRAQRARRAEAARLRAEAAHQRAEAQAQRQSEAHALKQELALAREARQRELHELRLEQARETLRRQPKAQSSSAHSEFPESAEDAALCALESLMNAPTPVTEEDFLRSRLSQAPNGFVSQNAGLPQHETVSASAFADSVPPSSCMRTPQ